MDFLVSSAWAQGGSPEGSMVGLLFPILLLVLFFFLFIRPQQKRTKEHRAMVDALKKGDEVVTNGGLAGNITDVGENFIGLQVADNLDVKVQKQAVSTLLPKGTLKKL
jgi:preprotein translocase subunit YajC